MNTISVWRATAPEAGFPTLQEEITTDVVIVGGGITGVTLALNLAEQGTSAVLLEARDLGFGSTGNSTGNLYETISRGIRRIVDRWGEDIAHAVTTRAVPLWSRSNDVFRNIILPVASGAARYTAMRPPTMLRKL